MYNTGLRLIPSAIIQSLIHQKKSRKMIKDFWALYPDHLVFLGEKPNILDQVELKELGEDNPKDGIYFILNQGVFFKGSYTETQFQYLECFSHIIHRLIDCTKVCVLNTAQILEITNWESEKYRINLSK
jgi:rhamnose utilization protein RhaD (predicted bifunctional aldolase and dehydrogenase)